MGNHNSGRRPLRKELDKILKAEGKKSLGIIMDIRDDKSNPAPVRLEAACYIANQLYGKPGQRLDIDAEVKSDVFWHVGKGYVDTPSP